MTGLEESMVAEIVAGLVVAALIGAGGYLSKFRIRLIRVAGGMALLVRRPRD